MTVVGGGAIGFWSDVYMSGTTFFTLGLGDVVPRTTIAKALTVVEAGTGVAFLAAGLGGFSGVFSAVFPRRGAVPALCAPPGGPPRAPGPVWRGPRGAPPRGAP